MSQVIVYTRADGGVSVVHPTPEWTGTLEELAARVVPADATRVRVIDKTTLPSRASTDERASWVDNGTAVVIDPVKFANTVSGRLAGLRAAAKEILANEREDALRDRAVALVLLDEINNLRSWITSFTGAVAAASSLADLKNRVAALAPTPQRTVAQAKAALAAKIDSTVAD